VSLLLLHLLTILGECKGLYIKGLSVMSKNVRCSLVSCLIPTDLQWRYHRCPDGTEYAWTYSADRCPRCHSRLKHHGRYLRRGCK